MILKIRPILVYVFTVRCYAERVIATASRPSVCLSVTLRYRGHTGWNTSKVISWLISLGCSLSADPQHHESTTKGRNTRIFGQNGWGR